MYVYHLLDGSLLPKKKNCLKWNISTIIHATCTHKTHPCEHCLLTNVSSVHAPFAYLARATV